MYMKGDPTQWEGSHPSPDCFLELLDYFQIFDSVLKEGFELEIIQDIQSSKMRLIIFFYQHHPLAGVPDFCITKRYHLSNQRIVRWFLSDLYPDVFNVIEGKGIGVFNIYRPVVGADYDVPKIGVQFFDSGKNIQNRFQANRCVHLLIKHYVSSRRDKSAKKSFGVENNPYSVIGGTPYLLILFKVFSQANGLKCVDGVY